MSRRRLSFRGVTETSPTENTVTDGGNACSLCLAPHTQLSVPAAWKNTRARELALTDLQLTLQSAVCRLCRDDIGRLTRDANVTPRWEKQKREKKCCVDMCDNTCYSVSSVGTREQIACILKCELVPYPTPLCHQHYHYVYDTLQSKATRCCTCNATLRNARKRVCPDSETIQKYLMQNTGFEGTIPKEGRVCPACYKSHLVILKKQPPSCDTDLQLLINDIKASRQSLETLRNEDDVIKQALQDIAVYVAEKLLRQECLLLPSVMQVFSSLVSKTALESHLCVQEKVTARWLLSNLIVYLQHHISYTCRIRKHGTLLYRSNGDLLTSISHLLHKHEKAENTDVSTSSSTQSIGLASPNAMLDDINSRLHQQICKFLADDLNAPYPVDVLDIQSLVSQIDQIHYEVNFRKERVQCQNKSARYTTTPY